MASFAYRVTFVWISSLCFLILLNLKLDEIVNWNWFIIFIPWWIFDLVVLTNTVSRFISKWKHNRPTAHLTFLYTKLSFIVWVSLKLLIEVLLCLKLEYYDSSMKLTFVFIPLWILFTYLLFDTGKSVIARFQEPIPLSRRRGRWSWHNYSHWRQDYRDSNKLALGIFVRTHHWGPFNC